MLLLAQVHLVIDLERTLEERLEGLVVVGVVGIATHLGVGVFAPRVQTFQESRLKLGRQTFVIVEVEGLYCDVLGELCLQIKNLLDFSIVGKNLRAVLRVQVVGSSTLSCGIAINFIVWLSAKSMESNHQESNK